MTSPSKTRAFVSSTLGTTLVSILAVWAVVSLAPAAIQGQPGASSQSSSHPLYRLSPIPAGADWTA